MSDIPALNVLLFAGQALAASIALPALAWLALRALAPRAALRHLAWVMVFAGLLALPVLMTMITPQMAIRLPAPGAPAAVVNEAVQAPVTITHAALPLLTLSNLLLAAAAVWLGGVLWVALQSLWAAAGLDALRRRGTIYDTSPLKLPARISGERRWQLRLSEDCPGPMTWGIHKATIMLPWAALRWTPQRLDTVLRHELAHVRRRDSLMQALALATCALYWPSPLVWKALAALRREAEVAADDAVIASGVRPSDYASELLELAREWRGQRQVFAGMAMAAPAALTERVQSILSPNAQRTGATAMDTLKLVWIGCLTTAALAAVRPSVAQTAPVAPQAPAAPAIVARPLAAPVARPAPPAPFRSRDHQIDINGDRTVIDGVVRPLTPEEKAALDRELAQIGPTVAKDIADAHIQERVTKQVAAESARIQAEVARQMAEIGPRIQKAMADARISEQVAKHMAEIQPRIDAAAARAQAASERAQVRAERAREAAERAAEQKD
jgi:beta-lactamase regulating signal transducer with metallopeptidase domain